MDMNKLFKCNRQLHEISGADIKIYFHDAPFIQYEQIRLNDNFQQYLKMTLTSKKFVWMGLQKILLQKSYKMVVNSESFTVDFMFLNRQFGWLKISITYDKSNKHER